MNYIVKGMCSTENAENYYCNKIINAKDFHDAYSLAKNEFIEITEISLAKDFLNK